MPASATLRARRGRWLLARVLVTAASCLTPPFGGAIIHYAVRHTHPRTARWADVMTLLGFVLWMTPAALHWLERSGKLTWGLMGALGVLLVEASIRFTRTTEPEPEPVTMHSGPEAE